MSIVARSLLTTTASSLETGRDAATDVANGFDGSPELVVVYLTVNHEPRAFLRGIRDVLGDQVAVIGCSTQGVVGAGQVREEGYAAGVMALGGRSVQFSHGVVENLGADPIGSGKRLGEQLKAGLSRPPAVVLLYHDPLSGVNVDLLLAGLYGEVECPILGGAAAQNFKYSSLERTFQFYGDQVLSRAAVAIAISGEVDVEFDNCNGCSPAGVELTVTRAEGNVVYELDHRRAADVWIDTFGLDGINTSQSASFAIGVPAQEAPGGYLMRTAYFIDPTGGGVSLGVGIPVGTRIMLHHRTVEDVLDGARRMGQRLARHIGDRTPRAVFGFECGARTRPFLGDEATLEENLELQRAVAGGDSAWLGMIPWGETCPVGGKPAHQNYSYPLLLLLDRA